MGKDRHPRGGCQDEFTSQSLPWVQPRGYSRFRSYDQWDYAHLNHHRSFQGLGMQNSRVRSCKHERLFHVHPKIHSFNLQLCREDDGQISSFLSLISSLFIQNTYFIKVITKNNYELFILHIYTFCNTLFSWLQCHGHKILKRSLWN